MSIFRTLRAALIATVITITAAHASPILLDLSLTVQTTTDGNGNPLTPNTFINQPTAGSVFHSYIVVDNSILLSDGISQPGEVLYFDSQIGVTQWNSVLPLSSNFYAGNQLTGFRGPCYNVALVCGDAERAIWGLGSKYLGFEVSGGKIIGVWGGVYGLGDFPFIDFNGNQYGSLSGFALSNPISLANPYSIVGTRGVLSVAVANFVPEPTSFTLLAIGLVFLFLQSRSKGSWKKIRGVRFHKVHTNEGANNLPIPPVSI